MKKVLLLFSLFTSWAFIQKLNAQCSISNVHITPTNFNPLTCQVTVNLDYTVALNSGSKHTIIHLWEASSYPNPAYVQNDYPLKTAQTAGMLGTIVIDYQGASPQVLAAWPTGSGEFKSSTIPSSPILTPTIQTSTVNSSTVVSFTNLVLNLSSCSQAVTIKGDVWATQNDQNASCLAAGSISGVANEPVMSGLLFCNSPRSFNVSFTTIAATGITFSAYKDQNGNGVFDTNDEAAGKLHLSGPGISGTATDVTVNNPASVKTTYGSYTPTETIGQASIFILARASGNNFDNLLRIDNTCSILPVAFTSFSATRNDQTVSLKWVTAMEENNNGFYVQRNTNGEWKNVAFVFSRADGGNSSQPLSYEYNDPNNSKSVSYYRIQQVDINGFARFSEIRTVRGNSDATEKLMLFPNPGTNGKINVLFDDDNSARDIMIYDATGRVVKVYKNLAGNNLTIEHLSVGLYNIQVKNLASQTVITQKFIIQNQ